MWTERFVKSMSGCHSNHLLIIYFNSVLKGFFSAGFSYSAHYYESVAWLETEWTGLESKALQYKVNGTDQSIGQSLDSNLRCSARLRPIADVIRDRPGRVCSSSLLVILLFNSSYPSLFACLKRQTISQLTQQLVVLFKFVLCFDFKSSDYQVNKIQITLFIKKIQSCVS